MPSDVMALCEAMLSRLGDDKKKYLQQAAQYFNIVLRSYDFTSLNTLHILFMVDESYRQCFLGGGTKPTSSELLDKWKVLRRQIISRCGGLLEVSISDLYPQFEMSAIGLLDRNLTEPRVKF